MIAITNEQIERVSTLLSVIPRGVEKALTGTIDRAKGTVRSETTKKISEVYYITRNDIRAETNIRMSTQKTGGSIVGIISFSGKKIPLYKFNTTPKVVTPGALVSSAVYRDNNPVPFKNAFIAEMRSGHLGVFKRKGKSRIPISEFMGLSTAQMAANSVVLDDVESAATETINKRLEAEINRILNGYGNM